MTAGVVYVCTPLTPDIQSITGDPYCQCGALGARCSVERSVEQATARRHPLPTPGPALQTRSLPLACCDHRPCQDKSQATACRLYDRHRRAVLRDPVVLLSQMEFVLECRLSKKGKARTLYERLERR